MIVALPLPLALLSGDSRHPQARATVEGSYIASVLRQQAERSDCISAPIDRTRSFEVNRMRPNSAECMSRDGLCRARATSSSGVLGASMIRKPALPLAHFVPLPTELE